MNHNQPDPRGHSNAEAEPLTGVVEIGRVPYGARPYDLADPAPEEAKIPLSQYLWILKRYRWRILGFSAASVIATLIISARLTPIYESIATVDIDRQTPADVVGRDATRNALNDADQFLATQMKLVQSDSVLRPVDQQFHLRELERQAEASGSARGEAAPVTLQRLKVTRPPNTYLMLVGYQSEDPQLAADAANAITQSYLEHTYNLRIRSAAVLSTFMERQLEELKGKMEGSMRALAAFERELNVINPEEKVNILGSRLLQLNTDYTAAEGARLRQQAAYESVKEGSIEAALATPQGDALRKLSEHRTEAREHFAEVQAFYGENHPEYQRAAATLKEVEAGIEATRLDVGQRVEIEFRESERREQMAREAMGGAKDEFDRVNAKSFEYQSVKREADADKNLYEELVRKIKEAGINAGFQNSAARIADPARPALKPVFPNLQFNGLLALLFSALLGIGAAVLSDVLDKTVRDPEQVARTLHAEVIGSLPLMKNRRGVRLASPGLRTLESGETVETRAIQEQDASGFSESVRTLRNSILLASFDRRYRSLLVTSAAPSEGKTTTAANLAAAHAEQGQRTLLIDGDLRRPSVHRNFNLPSVVGLSNVLLGEIPWRAAVIPVDGLPELHVLAAGPPSRRASDLIGRGLVELLEEAAAEYDLVMLDGPPLLGFAEPLQMATAVDGVIVVARAGQTSRRAVATVLATLNRVRAKVVGVVLNEVHKELSDSYCYYGYYRSYYRDRATEPPQEVSS
jgi:succinoglycan biosynthesis transport protein ExoP